MRITCYPDAEGAVLGRADNRSKKRFVGVGFGDEESEVEMSFSIFETGGCLCSVFRRLANNQQEVKLKGRRIHTLSSLKYSHQIALLRFDD